MAAVILFILLTFLHFTTMPIFSFSNTSITGFIPIPAQSAQQVAFPKAYIPSDISCNFIELASENYTISFESYIAGDFITTTVPRVLLYRSNEPVVLTNTDTMEVLDTLFKDSNIIVYVDPLKNDMYVSIIDASTPSNRITSKPIENVPLRTSFQTIITLSQTFMEIYIDGKFVQTVPFMANIAKSSDDAYFFGPPPIIKESIKVGNINFWNFIMSAKAIRAFASTVKYLN